MEQATRSFFPSYDFRVAFDVRPELYHTTGYGSFNLFAYDYTSGIFTDYTYANLGVDHLVTTGYATAAVPEPATWATMIGGFALVGGAARRQRGARVA